MGIKYIVDQIADLPGSGIDMSDIRVVRNYVILEKKGEAPLELGERLNYSNFKELVDNYVKEGWRCKTSMPVLYESEGEEESGIMSIERLTRQLLAHDDVVFLATNSTITNTYPTVSSLYEEMMGNGHFIHRAICLDTECASTGLALLIRDLIDSAPASLEEVAEYVMNNAGRIGHVFTWRNLNYIKDSGKVSGPIAKIANLLQCFPVCSVEYVGNERPLVTLRPINRGYKKAARILAEIVAATIEDDAREVVVAHGNDEEFALEVRKAIYTVLPEIEILDWRCGPIIQAHGGPTSIHVNYRRKYPNSYEETKKVIG